MYKRLKYRLISWLAKGLLPVVDTKELIVFTKNGKIFVGGEELTQGEINNLKSEARVIEQMRLWSIIVNKLNEKAQSKVYEESVDITDLLFGKTVLYVLNVQKQIINKLKK